MMTLQDSDAKLRALHAELSTLWDSLAALRDSLPAGSERATARRYAERVERSLQQIEALWRD